MANAKSPMKLHRIVVLGEPAVGKSAISIQMVSNTFLKEYDPGIEDLFRKQSIIDGEECILEIMDTASRGDLSALSDFHIREGSGFLLTYSITQMLTYERVRDDYAQRVLNLADPATFSSIVIVGNKCDLENQRDVPTAMVSDHARIHGFAFFETSAKTRKNIEEVFIEVVRRMRVQGPRREKRAKKSCVLL